MESLSKYLHELIINISNHSSKCVGQFRVAEIDLNDNYNNGLCMEGCDTKPGDEVDEIRCDRRNAESGGKPKKKLIDEDIISSLSYVTCFACGAGDNR